MSSTSLRPNRAGRLRRAVVAGAAGAALAIGGLAMSAGPAAAVIPPTLTLSKTTGVVYTGDTITVSGQNYPASTALFLTVCDFNDPQIMMGKGCLQDPTQFPVNIDQVTTDATGKFSKSFQVTGSLKLSATDVRDCMSATVSCVVGTTNAMNPADPSANAFSGPLTFAASMSKPGKAHLNQLSKKRVLVTWKGAVSGPATVTGYTVQSRVKKAKGWSNWKDAAKSSANQTWLKWTGKVGKTYRLRVMATSPVGTTHGKATKIRL